jgi:hypothetical protein
VTTSSSGETCTSIHNKGGKLKTWQSRNFSSVEQTVVVVGDPGYRLLPVARWLARRLVWSSGVDYETIQRLVEEAQAIIDDDIDIDMSGIE